MFNSAWLAASQASTHGGIALQRGIELERSYQAGLYRPYIWPWDAVGITLVLGYMLAPPTTSRLYFSARYPLFVYCIYTCIKVILECRSKAPPIAYGLGLIHAFAPAWIAFHLIWRDTRTESFLLSWTEQTGLDSNPGSATRRGIASGRDVTTNGKAVERGSTQSSTKPPASAQRLAQVDQSVQRNYYWKALPATLSGRLDWVLTMILALRGEGTSHAISSLPSPPKSTLDNLKSNNPGIPPPAWITDLRSPYYTGGSRRETCTYFLSVYAFTYLILDVVMYFIRQDPYFLGIAPLTSALAPSMTALPPISTALSTFPTLKSSPTFSRFIRMLIASSSMLTLLTNLTAIIPLLTYGIFDLRSDPLLYPSVFGRPYYSMISKTGLAGWWGLWWHQMFRLPFSAPLGPLCRVLGIKPRSTVGKLLGLVLAFGLSGVLHAAGSHTALGPSRPWTNSALFFWLQIAGVGGEMVVRAWLKSGAGNSVAGKVPSWIGGVLMMAWVHLWLYLTGPLMSDDCASAGVWLTEPVPVSFIEGYRGNGWFRWNLWMLPRWHWGDSVWTTGITI